MLEARGIIKEFGPVRVLHSVDFAVRPGEVHAVVGENGAGKSTLVKILCGHYQLTAGEVYLEGKRLICHDVAEGERRGVVMIHQEFNLADALTVEENVFLGREYRKGPFLDRRRMREETRRLLAEVEAGIDPRAPVHALSVSQKQMVEIAKALARSARVLIMDEPTAVLTARETEALFRLIGRLTAAGVAIVYISHRLDEVKRISDRVTVLRDGHAVACRPTNELTPLEMAALMVGRDVADLFPPKVEGRGDVALEVRHVSVPGAAHDCSFAVRRGEILGFAGLVGAGRTELMEGIFGLRRRAGGEILRDGRPIAVRTLADAVRHGMVYLTEDRKGKGLITSMPMAPNLTMLSLSTRPGWFIDRKAEAGALERAIETFEIRAPHRLVPVGLLSGGNQQKLSLAKQLEVGPEVIVFDEPTRGIDVGAKQQVYRLISRLAAQGKACIVISSELLEIVGLCHRAIVMREGRIVAELSGDDVNEEEIMRYATGVKAAG